MKSFFFEQVHKSYKWYNLSTNEIPSIEFIRHSTLSNSNSAENDPLEADFSKYSLALS